MGIGVRLDYNHSRVSITHRTHTRLRDCHLQIALFYPPLQRPQQALKGTYTYRQRFVCEFISTKRQRKRPHLQHLVLLALFALLSVSLVQTIVTLRRHVNDSVQVRVFS